MHGLNLQSPARSGKVKPNKRIAQGKRSDTLGTNTKQYTLTPCKGKSVINMAQSLSKIYIHLIFHIKTTSSPIRESDLDRIHSYIGQLVNATGCKVIQVGGICDHIHILFLLSKDIAISHMVEEVKRNSSRWMKTMEPYYSTFAWQNGYGVFSVSQSVVEKTLEYVKNQGIHHKKCRFKMSTKSF